MKVLVVGGAGPEPRAAASEDSPPLPPAAVVAEGGSERSLKEGLVCCQEGLVRCWEGEDILLTHTLLRY